MDVTDKVLIKTTKGVIIRKLNNILYVKAEGSYSTLYFLNGDYFVISKNLSQIKLPEATFFRIHASIIINLNYVKRIQDDQVILINETEFPVAKRRKKNFLAVLNSNFPPI